MALSPIFRDICEELDHLHSFFFDQFPIDLHTTGLLTRPFYHFRHPFCFHTCCDSCHGNGCSEKKERTCCPRISVGKDGIEMSMNVKQYKPDEISVKTVENVVQVEGKHNEKNDKPGCVSRRFVRRYALPRGYDPEKVESMLSPGGTLTVKAPAPAEIPEIAERVVPIRQKGLTDDQNA